MATKTKSLDIVQDQDIRTYEEVMEQELPLMVVDQPQVPTSIVRDLDSLTISWEGTLHELVLGEAGFFLFPEGSIDPTTGNPRTQAEFRPGMGRVTRILEKVGVSVLIFVQALGTNQWGKPKRPMPFRWKGGELSVVSREEMANANISYLAPKLVQPVSDPF
jgi:hypothetical protein